MAEIGRLRFAAGTHAGKVRPLNEDSHRVESWPDGSALLAVVADGLGGHRGGEVASRIAVETLRELLDAPWPAVDRQARYDRLLERFYAAHEAIARRSSRDRRLGGMGSTLVAAVVTPSEFLHLYAGDSRLYQFGPDGAPLYVTSDHSVVGALMAQGTLTEAEAKRHPMRAVVTSCLGGGPGAQLQVDPRWLESEPEPQPAYRALRPGETVLLCSDGLCGQISGEEMRGIARNHASDPDALVEALIGAALDAGGEDNITAIAVTVEKPTGECSTRSEI